MADGKIVIAVDVNGNEVSVLNKDLDQLEGKSAKAGTSIKSMVTALGLAKVAGAAINVLKSSLDSAISRFDTMQKFPKVMDALGFSASDSKKSIDSLSEVIDGLPTKLDDVVASTQQMTAITGDLKRSTKTVLALNNAFLASGASADDASRGTQQYNQMLSTGTVDLESWKTLQETMPLALQKTAEAMGFTGKSAQRDLYAALKEGNVTFDQFTGKLIELGTGTGMLADLAKENSLGIATSFGNLRNAVAKNVANMITKFDEIVQKLTGKSIAQNIDGLKALINNAFSSIINSMDLIIPIIQSVLSWFEKLSQRFTGNSLAENFELIKQVAVDAFESLKDSVIDLISSLSNISSWIQENQSVFQNLATVVFAVGGAILAFKGYMAGLSILSTITTIIGALNSAFMILSTVGLKTTISMILGFMGPVGWIITAIGALVAAVIYLWNTNEGFRNAVIAAWTAIIAFLQPAITSIAAFIQEIWGSVVAWWNENQQTILTTVQMVWTAIQLVFQIVLNAIQLAVSLALTIIQTTWDMWGITIIAVVQFVWASIQAIFQSTLSTIMAVVTGVMNQIQNIISTVMGVIQGVINVIAGAISGDWSRVWEGIQQITSSIINGIKDTISNVMEMMSSIVSGKIDAIKGFFESLGNIDLSGAGEAIINGFLRGLQSAFENVKSFVGGIADWIAEHKGPISYDKRLLIPAGKAIMGGFDESLQSNFKNVQRTVSGMADRLNSSFNLTPEMALGVGNIGTASSVNQIVNNSYSNGNSNRGMIDAIVKLANRPAIFKQEVDKREFSRIFAEPINEEQATSESFKNMLNGVKPKR